MDALEEIMEQHQQAIEFGYRESDYNKDIRKTIQQMVREAKQEREISPPSTPLSPTSSSHIWPLSISA